jgi:vancomycin resistance protein YoaR
MTKKKSTPLQDTTGRNRTLWVTGGILSILLLLFAIAGGSYWWFERTYALAFYPGVSVLDIELEGKTVEEATQELQARVDAMQDSGITVLHEETTLVLPPTLVPLDASSVEQELYAYDIETTLRDAYAIGRQGGTLQQIRDQWSARSGRNVELAYNLNRDQVLSLIDTTFTEYEKPAVNADITVKDDGSLETTPETMGQAFALDAIGDEFDSLARTLMPAELTIELSDDAPVITEADVEANRALIEEYVARGPITLEHEELTWTFTKNDIASWLSFASDELAVHPDRLEPSLSEVVETVNIEPKEGRWKSVVSDETVTDIVAIVEPEAGQIVQVEKTAAALSEWLSEPTNTPVQLAVESTDPKYTLQDVKQLGIEDVLGVGTSSAAGSPPNRIVNIARGIELLDGLIIEAEEEFSLNNALRPYDAANGYLAELVIVGNQTIPEYGGGLCQVGTTSFRAALNSGLDITERSEHSYAVSYYFEENGLPGTDATIYDGVVDFKFYNDTGNAILLNTDFADDGTLTFTFTGKSDGRDARYTQPTISGWVAPPPPKEILVDDLAPGERDCTESAHNGTDAQFTYTIDHADGRRHEETFTSSYKPWQAVCRVGKEKPKEEEEKAEEEPEESAEPETEKTPKKKEE